MNNQKLIKMSSFPEAPPNLKTIQPYLKIAIEHDQRDVVGRFEIGIEQLLMNVLKFREIGISKFHETKKF